MTPKKTSFPVYLANSRSEGMERTDDAARGCRVQVGNVGKRELTPPKQRNKAHQTRNVGTLLIIPATRTATGTMLFSP